MTMSAIRLTSAAAVAAGVAIWAGPALAAGLAEPKTSTEHGMTVMTLDDTETSSHFLPLGSDSSEDEFPTTPPVPGDAFVFTDDLRQDGVLVGTDTGKCTIVSGTSAHCSVVVTFAGGTVTVSGPTTFTEDGEPFSLPLTGGTGAYEGITGNVTVVDATDEADPADKLSTLTLTFTLPEASQVEAIPAGGAATGGGIDAGGTPVALIALAGAGMVTGAGIFGLGRRVRRD